VTGGPAHQFIYVRLQEIEKLVILLSRKKEDKQGDMSLKVEDVMVKEVVTIDENATVKEAAEVMNKFEIGCLISVKKGKAMGIMTERDLLKRVVADGKDASKTKVRDVMTSPLVVAEPSMDLGEAVKLMFQMKIKKLPVVDEKKLVGLVSLTDIARFQPQMIAILKQLAARQSPPRSIKKVIDYYVV
jgi:signal-transduction protein with cAMP-binding, CBS, and nucleotidyltransferase domain